MFAVMHGSHFFFFFFNDTATTEIYTLSLHDALPIYGDHDRQAGEEHEVWRTDRGVGDRKSTRLNSSHGRISYAVFCLKKINKQLARCGHSTILPCRCRDKSIPRLV